MHPANSIFTASFSEKIRQKALFKGKTRESVSASLILTMQL
jgi:hypothetical protein